MGWLSGHFREDVSLHRVADVFGVSESYLSRSFRQNTHFSFTEYVNAIRVQEACRLLVSTPRAVQDVAESCGFGSVTQFGRAFRKITGDSPLSYRRRSARQG
jgi:transcriptional regulator GlxA family with amidase domain